MSTYTLPEMALAPTAKICESIEGIVTIASKDAIDTITLSTDRIVIIKATNAAYKMIVKEHDGTILLDQHFFIEDGETNYFGIIHFNHVIQYLVDALYNPPEYVIPYATSHPIDRNPDDNGEFVKAIKAAMRSEPDC